MCSESKQPGDFYEHAVNASGVGVCKVCWRARVRLRRRQNPKVQEYDRRRASEPKRRRAARFTSEKWRRDNPERYLAQNALNNALRDGRIDRSACEVCDDQKVQGHCDDHTKPLEVRWLCPRHHHRLYADRRAAAASATEAS